MPSAGGNTGKDFERYRQVDLDFHRTLSNADHSPQLGEPMPGMLEGVKAILADDPRNKIIISCGGIGDYGEKIKAAFRVWLRHHGLPTNRFGFEDKPRTVAVIDDHALQFKGNNANEIWGEVLARLHRLDEKGPDVPLVGLPAKRESGSGGSVTREPSRA